MLHSSSAVNIYQVWKHSEQSRKGAANFCKACSLEGRRTRHEFLDFRVKFFNPNSRFLLSLCEAALMAAMTCCFNNQLQVARLGEEPVVRDNRCNRVAPTRIDCDDRCIGADCESGMFCGWNEDSFVLKQNRYAVCR